MHYLDYAATSAVRPPVVVDAISTFLTTCGATPGRGGHRWSVEAGREALRCRRRLCRLLGISGDPGRLAFMQNATHALNTALWGTLTAGDVVVVSPYAHNAVLRPAHALARRRGVQVRRLTGNPEGTFDLDDVEAKLAGARLLVVNAASNVLGTRAPLEDLIPRAHAAGAMVLVDAAQSAGHLEASGGGQGADMIAITGHKGLLGPQGTGALWVRSGLEVEPLVFGGSGSDSTAPDMPSPMPDRLEAGTLNAPGIVGLSAGVQYVLDQGVGQLHARESALKLRLWDGLTRIPGVRVVSPRAPDGVAVVTAVCERVDAPEAALRLDQDFEVLTRPGLHCSPDAHRLIGTVETGAVRFSMGWASTSADVDRALEGMEAIAGRRVVPVQ